VCARVPMLISGRDSGWLPGVGDMMVMGFPLGEVGVRPLGLWRPSTRTWRQCSASLSTGAAALVMLQLPNTHHSPEVAASEYGGSAISSRPTPLLVRRAIAVVRVRTASRIALPLVSPARHSRCRLIETVASHPGRQRRDSRRFLDELDGARLTGAPGLRRLTESQSDAASNFLRCLDDCAVVQRHDRGLGEPRRRGGGHLRPVVCRVLPMPGDPGW
jgi:hypothetical protein